MKSFRKIFILSFTLLLTFILASCTKVNKEYELIADEINPVYGEITFINMDENSIKPLTERTITMTDIALFLEQKAEHYPLSDEFIERYQQKSGGYIDNAKKMTKG